MMATLVSPGVEVTIIDESQYLPAATNTIPLFVVASAQNKPDASGTGIAAYTTAATANKLYQITSQRDLVNLYGVPRFYRTSTGTPLNGYELNEYGLQAAYSALGITNRVFVLRSDINLTELTASLTRPTAVMADGTYWLNTSTTTWGIYAFNRTTGKFTNVSPIVLTNYSTEIDSASGLPLQTIGNIGDYAVLASPLDPTTQKPTLQHQYFYKTTLNECVPLGSSAWKLDVPIVTSNANVLLNVGDEFGIGLDGTSIVNYIVPPIPDNTLQNFSDFINNLGWTNLKSDIRAGRLNIYNTVEAIDSYVTLSNVIGTSLSTMGISPGNYWTPLMQWGTSAQMPLWTTSQAKPRPTGSIWMKVGAAGTGYSPSLFKYNAATSVWSGQSVSLAPSEQAINAALDSSGGQSIPVGTVFGKYDYYGQYNQSPVYLQQRIATGATVSVGSKVVGTVTNAVVRNLYVQVSIPGSAALSSTYTVKIPASCTASQFVVAWTAQQIPYTTASVNTDGSLRLTHTSGGEIILTDTDDWSGVSNNVISDFGFTAGAATASKTGPGDSSKFYLDIFATEATTNYITCNSTAG